MLILDILREVLSIPALVIGIAAFIGLVLQNKPADVVFKGTINTAVGFIVLSAGSNFLQIETLHDFGVLFNFAFGIQGIVPNMEAIASVGILDYANESALIMCFGMIANIVIVKYSRFNYIFLTGHHTLYMACLIAVVLSVGGLSGVKLILAGALLLGFLMALSPTIVQKTVSKIMGNDAVGYGHFSTTGCLISAGVAKAVSGGKKPVKSTEDLKTSGKLSFIRDTTVAISFMMCILFIVITAFASRKEGFLELDINFVTGGYRSWITFSIVSGLEFAAGIYIILAGVRMVLAQIVPAFKGIADRLVPNAKPAIDCPILFPHAPNAVMIGFLMSFIGGLCAMACMYGINAISGRNVVSIIIPGVAAHFFCGAAAGVFGNVEGGLKGCIAGAFVQGIFISFMSLLVMPVLGTLNMSGTTFSDGDFCVVGLILGSVSNIAGPYVVFALCIVLFLLPIIVKIIADRRITDVK